MVIEIDGESHTHDEVAENDIVRQKRLKELGVRFLRFDDLEVKKEMNYVLNQIYNWIEENT